MLKPSTTSVLIGVLGVAAAVAQVPKAAPAQLSPRAAYNEALHPLEQTRASISNWSDAETAALAVSIKQGSAACATRQPKNFAGDDLVDLARLCALGQDWPAVIIAATHYIDAPTTPDGKPLLIRAYAARLDAALHLRDEQAALRDGQAMLATLPYDGLTDEVIREALEYMHFANTADALTLARARQPLLLAALRLPLAKPAAPTMAAAASLAAPFAPRVMTPVYITAPAPAIHDLYADALTLPELLQFNNQAESAAAALAELDAAVPTQLSADESLPIAAARRRYALLGKPLPPIAPKASLDVANRLPDLPANHAITALLLFPDWCTQCVRMGGQFPQTVFLVHQHEAYFYGLMAQTGLLSVAATNGHGAPAELLRGTPTLTVAPTVPRAFDANDFPFLIIADANGIVRLAQPVGEDALQPGGALDSAAARIGDLWPVVLPPSASIAPAAPASR